MQDSALAMLATSRPRDAYTLERLSTPSWHQGVVGLARLAPQGPASTARCSPSRAAAPAPIKGSGRSIAGAAPARRAGPASTSAVRGLLERFGGHAAAAGADARRRSLDDFRAAFEAVARERLTPADLAQRIETDGELEAPQMTHDFAHLLKEHVWGQGFPEPRFTGRFKVEAQKVVGERHTRLTLGLGGRRFGAIRFGSADALPARSTRSIAWISTNTRATPRYSS